MSKKTTTKKRATKKTASKKKVARKKVARKKTANKGKLTPPWGEDVELTPHMIRRNEGPRKFKSAEEIYELAEAFGQKCIKERRPMTITGMALALGFNSRDAFYKYEQDSAFGYAMRRVRTIVEEGYELRLHGSTPTGAIFALKSMGWQESPQKLELTGLDGGPISTVNGKMTPKEAQEAYAATLRTKP